MSYHFVTTFLFLRPAKEKERQNLTSYRSLLSECDKKDTHFRNFKESTQRR